MNTDTIAAIATPPGVGGVGIIRVSGPAAREILGRFFQPVSKGVEPRRAEFGWALDETGERLDSGLAIYFQGPASYTGEDVVEFQLHGSPFVLNHMLTAICDTGLVRLAQPGEFTRRAFENGKLSLNEAERLDLLIHAETSYEGRVATATRGLLGERLTAVREQVVGAMAAIEAAIEYPDEETETGDALSDAREALQKSLATLRTLADRFERLKPIWQGLQVVFTGAPNVGKSSLINRIAGTSRVLVTDTPGTTRDAVPVPVVWQGRKLTLVDTAGLRDQADAIEEMGMAHARQAIADADVVVHVLDATRPLSPQRQAVVSVDGKPVLVVINKIDVVRPDGVAHEVFVSARTGDGVDELLERLTGTQTVIPDDGMVLFTQRQYRACREAQQGLTAAMDALAKDLPEVAQRELQASVDWMDALLGRVTTNEVLDALFSGFCLGK